MKAASEDNIRERISPHSSLTLSSLIRNKQGKGPSRGVFVPQMQGDAAVRASSPPYGVKRRRRAWFEAQRMVILLKTKLFTALLQEESTALLA